ncbi:hypothetical protein ACUR5C_12570 [Aliikangiella sp. IMCC44653]
MPVVENVNPLLIIAALTGLLSFYYLLTLIIRVRKIKILSACKQTCGFVFFAAITGAISLLIIGTQGYAALTKEEQVAVITVTPTEHQNYHARIELNNGREQVFALKGDELVIEAYILKWKPWTNILGLHTAYRLERVSGRYQKIDEEQNKQRTVFAIDNLAGKGIAEWRESFNELSFLLDVEHGSASFISVDKPKKFQVMVTTSGLLIRPLETETETNDADSIEAKGALNLEQTI